MSSSVLATSDATGIDQRYSGWQQKSAGSSWTIDLSYPVPTDSVRYDTVIRKSRFIAITGPASDIEAVRAFVRNVSVEFDDARHICYAHITGSPDAGVRASSDDGEPQGTAGKPILNVLQHSGIGDIVAVVVRYFGGVKLGAGGLARAYGGSVAQTIKLLPVTTPIASTEISITAPFALENDVRHLLNQYRAVQTDSSYANAWQIHCRIATSDIDALSTTLATLGRGKIKLTVPD